MMQNSRLKLTNNNDFCIENKGFWQYLGLTTRAVPAYFETIVTNEHKHNTTQHNSFDSIIGNQRRIKIKINILKFYPIESILVKCLVKMAKVGAAIRELRIHLCQKSAASKGVRDWIENQYVPLKKANPNFPILIRECSNVTPKVFARYGFGKESSVILSDKSEQDVAKTIGSLTSAS